jgi:ADP-ribosylglycohydrolase
MLGAIIGDIVGSAYEFLPAQHQDFPLFTAQSTYTDDTVLTIAIAASLLENTAYATSLKHFGRKYPSVGYGKTFLHWLHSDSIAPYGSYGNGSAMRVSPIGFACHSIDEVLDAAYQSAAVTHNHPEGIKGAQATALAIYLARTGTTKQDIQTEIVQRFQYKIETDLQNIARKYQFSTACQYSVPESLSAFLAADDFESSLRNAILLQGDADTMACIAGGVAQSFYQHLPDDLVKEAYARLPEEFINIIQCFEKKFGRFR